MNLKKFFKYFIIFILFLTVFLFNSCSLNLLNQDTIPTISITIPDSLSGSTKTRATGAPQPSGVFEPFRVALLSAKSGIDFVNQLINSLNQREIPENYTGNLDNGNAIEITTDTTAEYQTKINIYTTSTPDPSSLYFQINFTKGTKKILVIVDLQLASLSTTTTVKRIKLIYDGDSYPEILQGWITFDASTTEDIYPLKLYFKASKNSDSNQTIEGGVLYSYIFDDDTDHTNADTTNPHYYQANHVYMFKAVTDLSSDYSTVNLYFPPSTETSNSNLTSVADDFLNIVFTWVNYPENTDVQTSLSNAVPAITYSDKTQFKTDLENWQQQNPGDTSLDTILFILNLNNPIYYNGVDGYVSNGDSSYTGYPDPALLDSIIFTYTPEDFENSTDFDIQFLQ